MGAGRGARALHAPARRGLRRRTRRTDPRAATPRRAPPPRGPPPHAPPHVGTGGAGTEGRSPRLPGPAPAVRADRGPGGGLGGAVVRPGAGGIAAAAAPGLARADPRGRPVRDRPAGQRGRQFPRRATAPPVHLGRAGAARRLSGVAADAPGLRGAPRVAALPAPRRPGGAALGHPPPGPDGGLPGCGGPLPAAGGAAPALAPRHGVRRAGARARGGGWRGDECGGVVRAGGDAEPAGDAERPADGRRPRLPEHPDRGHRPRRLPVPAGVPHDCGASPLPRRRDQPDGAQAGTAVPGRGRGGLAAQAARCRLRASSRSSRRAPRCPCPAAPGACRG